MANYTITEDPKKKGIDLYYKLHKCLTRSLSGKAQNGDELSCHTNNIIRYLAKALRATKDGTTQAWTLGATISCHSAQTTSKHTQAPRRRWQNSFANFPCLKARGTTLSARSIARLAKLRIARIARTGTKRNELKNTWQRKPKGTSDERIQILNL